MPLLTRWSRHVPLAIALGLSLLVWRAPACAEDVEVTTYTPAPYATYEALVAERIVDFNGGDYGVPPRVGTDWFLDPSSVDLSAALQGQVGIGTPMPQQRLHVNGKIRADDFCFNPDGASCVGQVEGWLFGGMYQTGDGGCESANVPPYVDPPACACPPGFVELALDKTCEDEFCGAHDVYHYCYQ